MQTTARKVTLVCAVVLPPDMVNPAPAPPLNFAETAVGVACHDSEAGAVRGLLRARSMPPAEPTNNASGLMISRGLS